MNYGGEHPGTPVRPPASAHLMVSSTDRYKTVGDRWFEPTTSANWKLNKPNNLLYGYFTRVALTQIQFQWYLPTIGTNKNDIFRLIIKTNPGGTIVFDKIFQVPQELYTGTQLATVVQDLVTNDPSYNVAWGFTFTFSTTTKTFTMGVNAGYVFNVETEDLPQGQKEIAERFLFTIGFIQFSFDVLSYEGNEAPLYYTRWLDICSDGLTQFQRVKDATTLPNSINNNVIARVYPTAPNTRFNDNYSAFQGHFVLCIDYNTPKHIKWSPDQALNNFDIQVFDEYGEYMAWGYNNESEYQLTFLASET